MAEIKLYGNAVNGDGKYIISPFDIAAPKADGKTAYTEDDKAADKNIVSYINSKVATLTSGIDAVKTGIAEVTFSPKTVNLTPGSTVKTAVSVKGNDGSGKVAELSLTMPSADTIVTGANSYTHLVDEFKTLQNSYSTLNTTVTDINGASSGYRKGDTDTLKAAKDYADQQITDTLGTVYKVCGTKSLTEAKALTNVKKGSVYNISEAFKIDGKPYPEYTNLLFLVDAATVTCDSTKGLDGKQVDALGGVQDLSAYSLKSNTISKVIINNNNATLALDSSTTLATISTNKEDYTEYQSVAITAQLPNSLTNFNGAKLKSESNKLSISGLTNLSGTTVTPLTYANTVINVTSFPASSTQTQKFTIYVTGELGTTGTSPSISLSKASDSQYGVVKIGKGINVEDGEITAQENTFTTTPYVSITSKTNATNGTDFVFDINCNTVTPAIPIIPLQKCDSTTLGIKYNLTKATYVKVYANGLDMAFDDSALSTKITGIESRISALETLLSLA